MDKRKELKMLYKQVKPEAGIYMIKCLKNGKMFVDSLPNIKSLNGKRMQLQTGTHMNELLKTEWNLYGEAEFTFDILEILEEKEDPSFDRKVELEKLRAKWLKKLKPFGDNGYNA
jgi:hypothetical protein